jgi:glucose/arabinose dehydrogenase
MLWPALSFLLIPLTQAQSCSSSLNAVTSPVATAGFEWDIISTNVSEARGIIFDIQGRLLIVQSGIGITALTLSNDSCATVISTSTVLKNSSLNHGIEFSPDGRTLYASSTDSAWSWSYNVNDATVSNPKLLVGNMGGTTHSTRTLHISPSLPNLLVISRGSDGNIDPSAASISSGHSQVKVFDLTKVPSGGYDYTQEGGLLAYGVRNEVGITSDWQGIIWGVMNSADDLTRNGTDISTDNPAEELHYRIYPLNYSDKVGDPRSPQTWDFGYPNCFTVWDPSPFSPPLITGERWTMNPNSSFNDSTCNSLDQRARLTFQAHSAPLDVKFFYPNSTTCSNSSGANAWGSFPCSWNGTAMVSFHGSWDRSPPTGYKVVYIPWASNRTAPAAANDSRTGYENLLYTQAVENGPNNCPNGCVRSVFLDLVC